MERLAAFFNRNRKVNYLNDILTTPVDTFVFTGVVLFILYFINGLLLRFCSSFRYFLLARIGVPCHEFAHYFFARCLFHKIHAVCWYQSPTTKTRSMGFVNHSSRFRLFSPITHLMVGIAPLFMGVLLIALTGEMLAPNITNAFSFFETGELPRLQALILLFVWLILSHAIANHMFPSKSDMKNSFLGALIILFIVVISHIYFTDKLNAAALYIAHYMIKLTPYLLTVLAVQLTVLMFSIAIHCLLKLKPH